MSTNKFTALPKMFDASQVAPATPMEALPPADYTVAVTDGSVEPIANGAGYRLELEMTVQDGPFKGRKIFDSLNLENPNSAKNQEIAQQQLSAICHATGVIQFSDVQQLYGRPFVAKINTEAGKWLGADSKPLDPQPGPGQSGPPGSKWVDARNRFRGAKAVGGANGAAPAAASAAPAWAKAPGSAPAPGAVAPATPPAAAPGTPPWAAGGKAPASTPAAPAPAAPPAAPAAPRAPAAPPAPKKERKFFVLMPDNSVSDAKAESEIAKMLASGMPAETLINPEGGGDNDWKPAGQYIQPPAAAATPPAAATPAGAPVPPPWART